MPIICPTITAYSETEYRNQISKVVHLAHRIQIDLTDGEFTKERSIGPEKAWWPAGFLADFHLMYINPMTAVAEILKHKPNLIIVQAEADGSFGDFVAMCKTAGVKIGAALLPKTSPQKIYPMLEKLDHVLIFSGNLGYQGGSTADVSLLSKVKELRARSSKIEIGWDGGVNPQNASKLIMGGVNVLNVGGYIQHAEDPPKSFSILQKVVDETGTAQNKNNDKLA